jgi:hypothetical protein
MLAAMRISNTGNTGSGLPTNSAAPNMSVSMPSTIVIKNSAQLTCSNQRALRESVESRHTNPLHHHTHPKRLPMPLRGVNGTQRRHKLAMSRQQAANTSFSEQPMAWLLKAPPHHHEPVTFQENTGGLAERFRPVAPQFRRGDPRIH